MTTVGKAAFALLVLVVGLGLIYLTGAFSCWEVYPKDWHILARVLSGIVGLAWTGLLIGAAGEWIDD